MTSSASQQGSQGHAHSGQAGPGSLHYALAISSSAVASFSCTVTPLGLIICTSTTARLASVPYLLLTCGCGAQAGPVGGCEQRGLGELLSSNQPLTTSH